MEHDISTLMDEIPHKYQAILKEIHKVVIGQDEIIRFLVLALLSDGHCILHGLPGLAKTLLVSSIAAICNVRFNRIQFTPDLMPADIIGTEIIQTGEKLEFSFRKGPIFTNILLADEINRTPPKTQSALLEAMQERAVTAYGMHYPMEYPFLVFATRNPIEQEGTYKLPEAQLDRFLFNIELEYPSLTDEISIASKKSYFTLDVLNPILSKEELQSYQSAIQAIPMAQKMIEYAVKIVANSRPETSDIPLVKKYVQYGASPRASQYVVLAAKAHAAIEGRPAVNKDDIHAVVYPILNHRIILNFAAYAENVTVKTIIQELSKDIRL